MGLTRRIPRKSGQIAGLLLIRMSWGGRMEHYLKTAETCNKVPVFNLFKLQKLGFFMSNISKHTDWSVCHEKTHYKKPRNSTPSSVCLLKILYIRGRIPLKNENLHISCTLHIINILIL